MIDGSGVWWAEVVEEEVQALGVSVIEGGGRRTADLASGRLDARLGSASWPVEEERNETKREGGGVGAWEGTRLGFFLKKYKFS